MGFLDGMMGGGDGSGYGALVDSITLTDHNNQNGKVGNAQATATASRQSQRVPQPTPTRPRTTATQVPSQPASASSAGEQFIMPDGTVVDSSGTVMGTMNGDGTVSPTPNGGGTAPGPSPTTTMNGGTEYTPGIGPEVYGAPEKKKRNTGLIVGGLLLLAGAAGGIGYAVYKSRK